MEKETHRFQVQIRQQDVDRFTRVIRRSDDPDPAPSSSVPLTFPAVWYGLPEVQSLISETIGVPDGDGQFAILHLEQSVEMHAPLQIGATYELRVQFGDLDANGKVRVSAQVRDLNDGHVASMTSLFAKAKIEQVLS
ncbi:hypothetical protein [Hoeflea sp.]|uniref:hypothetical protein n=1 Tax=Hoeflea sp. TaxID=1940281 RepID=UPI003B528DF9